MTTALARIPMFLTHTVCRVPRSGFRGQFWGVFGGPEPEESIKRLDGTIDKVSQRMFEFVENRDSQSGITNRFSPGFIWDFHWAIYAVTTERGDCIAVRFHRRKKRAPWRELD